MFKLYIWADLVDDGGWLPAGYGVRNFWGACLLFSLVLYPYVYMFARAAFAQSSCALLSASRILGCTPWAAFRRVALPVARPAIAVGALLVFMEVINDIAIAEDYGLQTLGYHIYDVWLNRDNKSAAAALALLLIMFALVLVVIEVFSRHRQRQYELEQHCYCSDNEYHLQGGRLVLAVSFCTVLATAGFFLPLGALIENMSGTGLQDLTAVVAAATDTLTLVVLVAGVGFLLGGALTYVRHRTAGMGLRVASQLPLIGYAFPGMIYGLGTIVAASAVAHFLAINFGIAASWLWTTIGLLIFALACRYIVITSGAVEAALSLVPPHYAAVGRNAGKSPLMMLLQIYLPLMRPALLVGVMLLAVDVIKELPLTLVLRPLGTDTLALLVYQHAADENLGRAAPAALLMILLAAMMLAVSYRWIVPAWLRRNN